MEILVTDPVKHLYRWYLKTTKAIRGKLLPSPATYKRFCSDNLLYIHEKDYKKLYDKLTIL